MDLPGVLHPELSSSLLIKEDVFLPSSTLEALLPFRRGSFFVVLLAGGVFLDIPDGQLLLITLPGLLFPALLPVIHPFFELEAAIS